MKIALSVGLSVFIFGICQGAFAQPLEVVLRLKEKVPMEQLAANVLNPFSSRYQKYYSPEEIRDLAGPSDGDYLQLKSQLASQGFNIISEDKTHLFVTVQGEPELFENIFSTKILQASFQDHMGQDHMGVRTKLAMPLQIPQGLEMVESVVGLDTTNHSRPHWVANANPPAAASTGLSPATIKTLYGFDPVYKAGLTGKGQHIAIGTYDGFNMSDIKQYYSKIGLKTPPKVDQVIFNGKPTLDSDSAVESEVDAEFSGMIAPGAQIHVFASSHNDDAGELQIFTAILDDNRAKIADYSWGSCETQVTPQHKTDMDKVFARAIAQGVNIMVASGDSGSDGCQDGTNAADWPADHPGVVAVGGTTANVTGTQLNEAAWNGSGGGISKLYSKPSWQKELKSPYVRRSFPDVSFNADPDTGENAWVQYQTTTPAWLQIGGTSIAAPQWSGFLALVNEARGSKGAVGFINPLIYGLSKAQHTSLFHDVTQGNNGIYSAGPGWDAVTGWGSMQADLLLGFFKGN